RVAEDHVASDAADPVVGAQQRTDPGRVDEAQVPQVEYDIRPAVALDLPEELFNRGCARDVELALEPDRQRPRLGARGACPQLTDLETGERRLPVLRCSRDGGRATRTRFHGPSDSFRRQTGLSIDRPFLLPGVDRSV